MKHIGIIVACFGLLLAAGCRGVDERRAAEVSQLRYPGDAPAGPDLDIVVRRDGGSLKLLNRTPTTYRDVQVWLNQQFVSPVAEVPIAQGGRAQRIGLNRFINHRGDGYPVGGFLTPDKGFPIVLAELYDPASGLKHRLLVRSDR